MRVANGVAMIDSSELDDQTAAAIATVAQTRDGIKIKFHDLRGVSFGQCWECAWLASKGEPRAERIGRRSLRKSRLRLGFTPALLL
jgi:hypothetical protein